MIIENNIILINKLTILVCNNYLMLMLTFIPCTSSNDINSITYYNVEYLYITNPLLYQADLHDV